MRLIPMYRTGEIARMIDPNRLNDDDYLNDVYSVIFYHNVEGEEPVFMRYTDLIDRKDRILRTIDEIKREENNTDKTISIERTKKQLSYLGIIQTLIDAVLSGRIPEEFVINRYSR